MDFSGVLYQMKLGKRVRRAGWNGKGMWLSLVEADHYRVQGVCNFTLLPWIGMKTADDCYVPWLCSQADMLADDWEVIV